MPFDAIMSAGSIDQYKVPRSVRCNPADSAYFARTQTATNPTLTKMTHSIWFKRGQADVASGQYLIAAGTGASALDGIRFAATANVNRLQVFLNNLTGANCATGELFLDNSEWYHLVVAIDTTLPTSTDRIKLYINNVFVPFVASSFPSLGYSMVHWGVTGQPQGVGGSPGFGNYHDGLVTEYYAIYGQALDPSYFGAADSSGRWVPAKFKGTYSAIDVHLDFSDNSNTTAATLGADRSGNGNDYTPNNFSVASGTGNDSLTDSPSDYADTLTHGNYPILDAHNNRLGTISNGGMDISTGGSVWSPVLATMEIPQDGDTYRMEVTILTGGGSGNPIILGVAPENFPVWLGAGAAYFIGYTSDSYGYHSVTGNKYNNNVGTAFGAAYAASDVIDFLCTPTTGDIAVFRNGTLQGHITGTAGQRMFFAVSTLNASVSVNFGQRPFANNLAPAGFTRLCSTNLPANEALVTSGSFTGNASADGPVIHLNGTPSSVTINGNAVTWGTHAYMLSDGFKVITTSASYNANGTNTFVATVPVRRKNARATIN